MEEETSPEVVVDKTEIESEENLADVLEKETSSTLPNPNSKRATDAEILEIVKPSLYKCNSCRTDFLKRKEKAKCPCCHSTDVSSKFSCEE